MQNLQNRDLNHCTLGAWSGTISSWHSTNTERSCGAASSLDLCSPRIDSARLCQFRLKVASWTVWTIDGADRCPGLLRIEVASSCHVGHVGCYHATGSNVVSLRGMYDIYVHLWYHDLKLRNPRRPIILLYLVRVARRDNANQLCHYFRPTVVFFM